MKLDPKKITLAKKKMKAAYDRFMALSPEDKAREADEFDREMTDDELQPISPEERHIITQIAKRGRPKTGHRAKRVLVSLAPALLAQVDAQAKAQHITRSAMIAHGLKLVMAHKPKKLRTVR